MKALVLSAGRGERLRPLTDKIPKPLLEVDGRPLIHYPLKMLKAAGIGEVAMNLHHLADQFEGILGDGGSLGLKITYSYEPELRGTGGPLLALRNFFAGETFVVANSDTLMDLDLRAMLGFHRARRSITTMALYRSPNLAAYSLVEIDPAARIRRMRLLRRGGYDDYPAEIGGAMASQLQAYIFCGAYVCEPAVFETMPDTVFSSMGDIFAPMVARGMMLFGYIHRGLFRTLDDLAAYEALQRELVEHPGLLNSVR